MRTQLFLLFLAFVTVIQSQMIEGKVFDAETNEPIPFANVFFIGSLTGTTTGLEGEFSMKIPDDGKFDLAITFIGYYEHIQSVESGFAVPFLSIALKPEVIQLADVQITADTAGWANNFQGFRPLFLGRTENASKVTIENPKDIYLFYDHLDRSLIAHSRKEIKILNHALGYQVDYIMKSFEMDYSSGLFTSYGIPRFSRLNPKNKREARRWSKNRMRAYHGSFEHFLKTLASNTFSEEGFIVQELYRIPNPNRPPQSLIDQKLSELKSNGSFGSLSLNNGTFKEVNTMDDIPRDSIPPKMRKKIDSLIKAGVKPKITVGRGINDSRSDSIAYWNRMNRMPIEVDSLGRMHNTNELLMDRNTDMLTYTGLLRVVYTRESEEPNYALDRPGGNTDTKQTSTVVIEEPVKIYPNGYYDVEKIFFMGYFGWASRMAEMMPLGFLPEVD